MNAQQWQMPAQQNYGAKPLTTPTISAMQNQRQALPNAHKTPHTEFAWHSREQPHNSQQKKQATFGETHNNDKVENANTVHLTYNSGADGHYVSEDDRKESSMPILRP